MLLVYEGTYDVSHDVRRDYEIPNARMNRII